MGTEEPRLDRHDAGLRRRDTWTFSVFTRRAAIAVVLAAVVIVGLLGFWQLINTLLILFLAVLFSVFLRGPTNWVAEHTPIAHGWALFAIATGLVGIFVVTIWLLEPSVADEISHIAQTLPSAYAALRDWLKQSALGSAILPHLPTWRSLLAHSGSMSWGGITGTFSSAFGVLSSLFFIAFVGLYLAVDPALYKLGMVRLVPMAYRERSEEILDTISHQLGWWLVGRLFAMFVVAALTTAGLWIMNVPLPITLGLTAGLMTFVPIIGPLASFVPAALVAILEGPTWILYVAVLYLAVHLVEGYFLTPLVQQRAVSVPPALILVAQFVTAALFGVVGVVVATPIVVVVLVVLNLLYVEDILGDTTPYSAKIPGAEHGRRHTRRPGRGGAAPHRPEPTV